MNADREKFLLFRVRRFSDQQAFKELHAHFEPRVLRFLGYKLPTRPDVEDATNEVFMRAWDYLRETPVTNFGGFLYQVARNVSASFYRARGRKGQEVELEEATEVSGADEEQIVESVGNVLSLETIERSLPKLKEEYRDLIIMRYMDEMSVREIAQALEKTEGNVRITILRALKSLRKMIDTGSQE